MKLPVLSSLAEWKKERYNHHSSARVGKRDKHKNLSLLLPQVPVEISGKTSRGRHALVAVSGKLKEYAGRAFQKLIHLCTSDLCPIIESFSKEWVFVFFFFEIKSLLSFMLL